MRIVLPTGSVVAKRILRTVSPITATLAAVVTSSWEKPAPLWNPQARISKNSGVEPVMRVPQLSFS